MHDRAGRGRGEYASAHPGRTEQTELSFSKDRDRKENIE